MIRKANLADVEQVHRLVEHYARQGRMLHRSLEDIVEHIRCFCVAESGGVVVACSALHVYGPNLAEIKSLAVDERKTRQGWGAKLVRYQLDEAISLGIGRAFALTYEAPFFEKQGFHVSDKQWMPEKIWRDCLYCQKYDDCDEVCVAIDIETGRPAAVLPVLDA
jgi:amino-acid N-acetyltransferase